MKEAEVVLEAGWTEADAENRVTWVRIMVRSKSKKRIMMRYGISLILCFEKENDEDEAADCGRVCDCPECKKVRFAKRVFLEKVNLYLLFTFAIEHVSCPRSRKGSAKPNRRCLLFSETHDPQKCVCFLTPSPIISSVSAIFGGKNN